MFVTDERVEIVEFDPETTISDRPPNRVWIRAKMNVKIANKVKGSMIKLGPDGESVEFDMGENLTSLLIHNILAWSGPDFTDPATGIAIPCTPENISNLDANDSFVVKVADEISRRNLRRKAPNPKSSMENISPTNGSDDQNTNGHQNVSLQLATTIKK